MNHYYTRDQASLMLLTDLYQLTMAYGYWKNGKHRRNAVFHLFYRKNPFNGGFGLCCGLALAIELLNNFKFSECDVDYLATLVGSDGEALFESAYLDYLRDMKFECDVDAIPEGTIVFPHEPLIRIKGPIDQCQILETPLLNFINYQTLVATKASRIVYACKGDSVFEFGLRRAQGIDGALAASRAAYIGGCSATSNVMAGKLFDIPVKGPHAHSWVMSFEDELEAFKAYAEALPNNCVFLVDTYNTIEGVNKAIKVGKRIRERGNKLLGVRLDSGDLAYLSVQARRLLDEAGFKETKVVASNDLDEFIVRSLKEQGAKINIWGIGTKLVTCYDQPALGGVYKLGAIAGTNGDWQYKIKLSEQSIKTSNPGILQVRRFRNENEYIADAIYDISANLQEGCTIIDPLDPTRSRTLTNDLLSTDLLVPIFRLGDLVYQESTIHEIQRYARDELKLFHAGVKRFENPHVFPVGLERHLHELKTDLVMKTRKGAVDE